jgi:hypothetical protein
VVCVLHLSLSLSYLSLSLSLPSFFFHVISVMPADVSVIFITALLANDTADCTDIDTTLTYTHINDTHPTARTLSHSPSHPFSITPSGPGPTRQTLLFSATFSKEVKEVAAVTLRKGYSIIDTVGEEVEQTHSHGETQVRVFLTSLYAASSPSLPFSRISGPEYHDS